MSRFRSLVPFLRADCRVYRQTWQLSTVLYIDFLDRPEALATAREHFPELSLAVRTLGLGRAIVFTFGNKVIEWHRLATDRP